MSYNIIDKDAMLRNNNCGLITVYTQERFKNQSKQCKQCSEKQKITQANAELHTLTCLVECN